MKFGLYLTRKGVITAEQLVAALECQHSKLVPIGQLALEECVLSAPDVFKVLRCQSGMPHERFGDVAVSMGLMTQDELERLLLIQSDRKLPFSDVLVRQGVLSFERADEELAAYRREMERRKTVIKRRIPTAPRLPAVPEMPDAVEAGTYAMLS